MSYQVYRLLMRRSKSVRHDSGILERCYSRILGFHDHWRLLYHRIQHLKVLIVITRYRYVSDLMRAKIITFDMSDLRSKHTHSLTSSYPQFSSKSFQISLYTIYYLHLCYSLRPKEIFLKQKMVAKLEDFDFYRYPNYLKNKNLSLQICWVMVYLSPSLSVDLEMSLLLLAE